MQGRLLEQTSYGYQAFPVENWKKEFPIAEALNFDHIEWIFDVNSASSNPILDSPNLANFLNQQKVRIVSVCGDYFMDEQIHLGKIDSLKVLISLVENMQFLDIKYLILPFVDQSSAKSVYGLSYMIDTLNYIDNLLSESKVFIALETDLNPSEFKSMLGSVNPERYCVNYDIGNSASLGYNFQEELDAYGDLIRVLHIKDRLLSGQSVHLGQGNAKIEKILKRLADKEQNIITTLQCFRDFEGLKVLKNQLKYLHEIFLKI